MEADFSGGAISSNGGIQLLAQVDRRLGLTGSVARSLEDSRRQASCDHRLVDLLRQRVYALALGHEDLNDHGELRHDPALQTAAGRLEALASPSTLCRLEQRVGRETAVAVHEVLFEQFVAAHPTPPRRLILDFDATDTLLHGEQEERFFHAYYDGYCYLPLYVFCGRHLLVSYLRPSGVDAARHALGDSGVAGQGAAGPLAAGEDRVSGRQWLLPVADAALVRIPWRGLYCGNRPEPPSATAGGGVAGMREAGLPGHGQETAPVRFGMVCGTYLGSGAAGDREGRAYRPWGQPTLRGDQPVAADGPLSLHPAVLRPRGHGESDQEPADGSLR